MDKVLIAEDNATFLTILKAGLERHEGRFEIITAKDGEEAIKVLERESISLLVTDLRMPKIHGLDLLAYMNQAHPGIPCIVITAHGTPQIKEMLQEDVLHYIEKPFKAEDLARLIIPALDRGSRTSDRDVPDGSLKGISIASFLQMIEMEEKTCIFEITAPKGEKGFFYFENGELHDALYGKLVGKEAALKMIPLKKVLIRFRKQPKRKITRRIEEQLMGLIMEAMKLKDEASVTQGEQ